MDHWIERQDRTPRPRKVANVVPQNPKPFGTDGDVGSERDFIQPDVSGPTFIVVSSTVPKKLGLRPACRPDVRSGCSTIWGCRLTGTCCACKENAFRRQYSL